jgi:hypothetical protein
VRKGLFSQAVDDVLQERLLVHHPLYSASDALYPPVHLICKNVDVDAENARFLSKLAGTVTTLVSNDTMTGADSDEKVIALLQTIDSRMPSDLQLKPSAQVPPARHLPGH